MLTSVFYYGYYKPYIMNGTAGSKSSRRDPQAVVRDFSGGVSITKNNSIKKDVLDYAGGVFKNVTDMKEAAKYLSRNSDTFYTTVLEETLDTAKDWAIEDLSAFANAYNAAVGFTTRQEHSEELADYGNDLKRIAVEYGPELKRAGITVVNDGELMSASPNEIRQMDYLELGGTLTGAAKASRAAYRSTAKLLESPLYTHMDFRQLSYYYNYGITPSGKNTSALLLTGIILDRAI